MPLDSATEFEPCSFFRRFALDVARELLGRSIVVRDKYDKMTQATIVETEAYGGADDPASHAAFKPGGRASQMFGNPGSIYVYSAYGMYPCLNFVTDDEGLPGAVLVRGISFTDEEGEIRGPGRTAKALGITLDDQGTQVCCNRIQVSTKRLVLDTEQTPRIGIKRGISIPWRFSTI